MNLRSRIGLFLIFVLITGSALADPDFLPYETKWTPYQVIEQNFLAPFLIEDGSWLNGGLLFDANGDDQLDTIDARNPGISCRTINQQGSTDGLWWYNVPPQFAHQAPCADLSGVWDVTGEGCQELVLMLHNQDRTLWAVERLDVRTGELIRHLELPPLVEKRQDGLMDTDMFVAGVMDTDGRKVLILFARTGHDIQPRGPLAMDIDSGEIVWQYRTGPKPFRREILLVDLDGDGPQEIVFSGGAMNNIHDQRFEGLRDDRAYIFCLENNGVLRWRQPLEEGIIHTELDTLRQAGSETCSILYTTQGHSSAPHQLGLLNSRGELITRTPLPSGVKHNYVVPRKDGSQGIYFASSKGRIGRYDFRDGQFHADAQAEALGGNISISLVEDFLPEPGVELVTASPGHLWVLSEDFEVLAHLAKPEAQVYYMGGQILPLPDGTRMVVNRRYEDWPSLNFSLVPNPRPFPVLPVTGASLLGVGGVAVIWHRRRNRRSAATVRELRLQLMTRLQLASHGKIGALSALRRLLWTHQTCEQGFQPQGGAAAVYGNWGRECLKTSLPNLQTALDLAELGELDGDIVQRARGSLKALRQTLEQLETAGFADAAIRLHAARLEELAARAEADFMELRRSVEHLFQADPGRILLRSLEANRTTIDDYGIEVDLPEGPAPLCRMDEQELIFILDNLVENALRAMLGSPTRRFGIAWERVDDQICLLISDTGCGIIPEDWERIFTAGHSTRRGGGLGLTGSREVLTKYGGSLTVRSSKAGQGTTMMLLCPAAGNGTTIH